MVNIKPYYVPIICFIYATVLIYIGFIIGAILVFMLGVLAVAIALEFGKDKHEQNSSK